MSKVGTLLLALSASVAMLCTGCATELSDADTEDGIESEGAIVADATADATDDSLAEPDANAAVADANDEATAEDAAALNSWWGAGYPYYGGRFRGCGAPCGGPIGVWGGCAGGFYGGCVGIGVRGGPCDDPFELGCGPIGGIGGIGPCGGAIGPCGGPGLFW
ncbi:hypothetical protein [Polyangium sp. 15x6]|uniref:hypothetical protein n=1 Tax=Polyangium sp. 15x6 TaxID=3042687 RepID=UPI00249BB167|nr:hypothetical protein [Polyangium sp. 15x6]MDI3291639.1 hypothetical protein [Polyangium sp. 15x6]